MRLGCAPKSGYTCQIDFLFFHFFRWLGPAFWGHFLTPEIISTNINHWHLRELPFSGHTHNCFRLGNLVTLLPEGGNSGQGPNRFLAFWELSASELVVAPKHLGMGQTLPTRPFLYMTKQILPHSFFGEGPLNVDPFPCQFCSATN